MAPGRKHARTRRALPAVVVLTAGGWLAPPGTAVTAGGAETARCCADLAAAAPATSPAAPAAAAPATSPAAAAPATSPAAPAGAPAPEPAATG
jgi:pilus assembly protein FimV